VFASTQRTQEYTSSPTYAGYRLGCAADPRFESFVGGRSTGGDEVSMRDLKGSKWGPDPLLDTSDQLESGIAHRARAPWRRSPHSSQTPGVMPGTRRRGAGVGRTEDQPRLGVLRMQSIRKLMEVLSDRGRRGLGLERVYRHLSREDLLIEAYAKIGKNDGALTRGVDGETVNGMSREKIQTIGQLLRDGDWIWKPVRRIHIPKRNGKTRPLGIPTWSDKLVQQVMKFILEAYYERQFSRLSFGFRSGLGCHHALKEIMDRWRGIKWFIDGDISKCFDSIDYRVLLSMLGEKIHDDRFLKLVRTMLEAGYLEDWRYGETLSGTPQGGISTPPCGVPLSVGW
jgi:hypothetical protein